MSKDKSFEWLSQTWQPLIHKTLSKNYVLGLDREDLEQEIWLVIWECFLKNDVQHFTTYLSRSINNKLTDLHAEEQRYYYPSLRLRCVGCGFAVSCKPKQCPECNGTRWKEVKGPISVPLYDNLPYIEEYEVSDYPEEIEEIINSVLFGKKTGHKQKEKLRNYLEWELAEV